jgi:hypothetical protein
MNIKNMLVAMSGYPEVKINEAGFEFTPAYASMTNTSLNVGAKSDFMLTGRLENYIPYVFSDKTIKGNLSLHSKLVDVSEILSKISSDTTLGASQSSPTVQGSANAPVEDTTSLSVIKVPENIDFDFDAVIDEFTFDNIKAQKVKGHIIVRNGILSLKETGMNILNGIVSMNADYDTRDTLKPVMKADFDMKNIGIKDAFVTFNTVQKLAPAAKGIDGKISAKLSYVSLLGRDMMPVTSTINGSGKLQSDEITLVESATFDKMKEVLKLGDKYSNTFKDINVSFKISDGRIFVSPFDVKTGNLKMNISGDQGIDQTLNYIVKTEIPRADLGGSINSFIDNVSAQAAAFGINYKPSDILKVNVRVTGTFKKPIVAPFFGNSTGESTGGVKETAKEVVKQTVDDAVDKAREKARAEAEIQGDKLVKEAEGRGQQLRDEAAKAAEQMRKEAEVQGKNLIDGAASKGIVPQMAAKKSAESLKVTADRKAEQLIKEADNQANKLVEEAKAQKEAMINKI